ncbi:hydroxymethylglutaryl-CoA reductase, degradative [Virgibacillus sp. W0181]|uniref:hydroxymethylglutaryl-CoA reductase, degradative n=1 Tax=Virgibacillus sp. W0181 TaxID=3391581 RepID=UPI003F4668E0
MTCKEEHSMTSHISGFYKLPPKERLEKVADYVHLTEAEKKQLMGSNGLTLGQADQMIENAVGSFSLPFGVAVNFNVNGKDVFIPMVTEEPSVVAAASNAAKQSEGFTTSYSGSMMRGQMQVVEVAQPYRALAKLYENKNEILHICNEQDRTLVDLGGGAKDLEAYVVEVNEEKMVVLHLLIDTKDAMGANAVNTMVEATAPFIEKLTGAEVVLRILSNLADERIVRASANFTDPFHGDEKLTKKFIQAYELAVVDAYRAATHNKGIMNGITAVVLATGNDTRAIEAGAHAYAARSGMYRSLTHWEADNNGSITGTIEIPMAVGLVGGATQSNPMAKIALKILGAASSGELAGIIASVGLAQNFAALRALVQEGIQEGHMKLHAKNMAAMAGAREDQIERAVKIALKKGKIRYDEMIQIVLSLK